MPENKEKTKKLVEEELKKQGVEATDEVVEQLAKVAGSDLEGVGGGMSVAGKVALTVGGAVAMAALGATGMYLGEKAYDKHKGRVKVGPNDQVYAITQEAKEAQGTEGQPGYVAAIPEVKVPGRFGGTVPASTDSNNKS